MCLTGRKGKVFGSFWLVLLKYLGDLQKEISLHNTDAFAEGGRILPKKREKIGLS